MYIQLTAIGAVCVGLIRDEAKLAAFCYLNIVRGLFFVVDVAGS